MPLSRHVPERGLGGEGWDRRGLRPARCSMIRSGAGLQRPIFWPAGARLVQTQTVARPGAGRLTMAACGRWWESQWNSNLVSAILLQASPLSSPSACCH